MKIGIIVISDTGHTYSVAVKLKDKLSANGHQAELERLEMKVNTSAGRVKNAEFKSMPEIKKYDALVFAAPVHAFALHEAMKSYLGKIPQLPEKKVALFTTQFFPFKWMGGNNAIRKMKKMCKARGAVICTSGVVNWGNKKRNQQITDVVNRISTSFAG